MLLAAWPVTQYLESRGSPYLDLCVDASRIRVPAVQRRGLDSLASIVSLATRERRSATCC